MLNQAMAQDFALFGLRVWFFVCVFGVEMDEMKSLSVMEGENVTLHTDVSEIQRDDLILWWFGSEDVRIADVNRSTKIIFASEGLSERLKLDQTGSLTITNISITDSGLYKVQIIGNKVARKTFSVTVYARLTVPVITSYCPQNSSSSSVLKCVLLCSVMNVTHVSLSWYKGKSLLSSISVSDLNIRLSLPLEVENQDTNTYRCVINNPITNHTQHLNINDVCHTCSDCVNYYMSSCDTLEAVIRLVISGLVGVAAVAASIVLVHDIRSRRAEENEKDQTSVKR
ncbi:carcinoembryonic antigen-related cell adhesion molecule 3-like [Triplophysa rosa]|uniref:carcinoembryonic antigen-related cell adhesion molecule 3-like n=1 Tax=Triplophysa rosa TaxID=992332 RepID=UPI00254612B0|nr:carcinoembryonic antigen-related cell adhesion molecule 3-like [Triplophysa rosa]